MDKVAIPTIQGSEEGDTVTSIYGLRGGCLLRKYETLILQNSINSGMFSTSPSVGILNITINSKF